MNCQLCEFYKDGYCENLELKPCYPSKGCEDFSKRNELKKDTIQVLEAYISPNGIGFHFKELEKMGMTIDEARIALGKERKYALHDNKQAFDIAIDTMHKYQMMQADYKNRLKADMVAMLEDLDLQIDELCAYNLEVAKVQRLIRDRINKLKENKE